MLKNIDDPIAAREQHLLIIDGLTAIAGEHEPAFACGEGYGRGMGKVSARGGARQCDGPGTGDELSLIRISS
jgi:hypothetical protein